MREVKELKDHENGEEIIKDFKRLFKQIKK